MAIVEADVKLYESAEMSDEDTSGGLMGVTQITCGSLNNLFPNISRLDRLHGRVQFRKVYVKINSQNTDTYSGSHIGLSDLPEDPETSVVFFEAANHPEERSDLMSVVEDYFEVGNTCGDAQCAFPVKTGSHSITFQIEAIDRKYGNGVWYPSYGSAVDWVRTLDVNVGDVIFIDDGTYSEFVQVSRIETTESYSVYSPNRRKGAVYKHVYTVESIEAGGGSTSYSTGWTANRTYRKNTWKAYGSFFVTQDITAGDHVIYVGNTNTRLIPTTYGISEIFNDKFLLGSSIVDDVEVGPLGYEWEMDNVRQPWHSDYKVASEGQATYATTVEFPPIVAGSVKIWIRKNGKWEHMLDDGTGSFTADSYGTGSIDYTTGSISWTCTEVPDYPSDFIILYQMGLIYAENEYITVGTSGSLPRTLTFGMTNIVPGSIRIEYDAGGQTWKIRDDENGNLVVNYIDWLPATDWSSWTGTVTTGSHTYYNSMYYDAYYNLYWKAESTEVRKSSDGLSWSTDTDPTAARGAGCQMMTSLNTGRQVMAGANASTDFWYRDGGSGAWTTVTHGSTKEIYAGVWVDGTAQPGGEDYFIFAGEDGRIFYSTDGTSYTEIDLGSQAFRVMKTDPTNTKVVLVGGLTGADCYFYDRANGAPTSGNWTSRPGFGLGKEPRGGCCTTYEGTDYWTFIGDDMKITVSGDDGASWTTPDITYIGSAWASTTDLFGIGSDSTGHALILPVGLDDVCLQSYDGGQTYNEYDKLNNTALYNNGGVVMWNGDDEKFIIGRYYTAATFIFHPIEVPFMTGLTDDIVGSITYSTGSGLLSYGLTPTTDIEATYFLSDKDIKSVNIQFNGASDIVQNTFKVRAEKLSSPGTVMTIEEAALAITGDGTGTLDKDNGTFIGEFDYAYDPDTLTFDYSFDAILSTEFSFNYDEIDRSVFPPDGYVPGVKTGDTILLTDGTNEDLLAVQDVYQDRIVTLQAISNSYTAATPTHVSNCVLFGDLQAQKGIDFDQQTWDTTTWQDTVQGSPASANYDWATYPLTIDNKGAATERWGIYITAVTTPDVLYEADVYSENHGVLATSVQIGSGAAGDLSVVNPATTPSVYWTLDKDGWGGSWAIGNLLRFNTEGCDPPVWIVRVINAKSSDQVTDNAETQIRGDIA